MSKAEASLAGISGVESWRLAPSIWLAWRRKMAKASKYLSKKMANGWRNRRGE
jgi:hypothetical protein